MTETIAVPITLVSLGAAVESRVAALTPESSPSEILAIIRLVETLSGTLDRLAMEFVPDVISTRGVDA
jgi:hypothetical protein